jgi:Adaptive response protein AidB N-terminal domain
MLEPAKHNDVTAVGRPGLLAPDTSGMNFYRADPALTDLQRIHLPDALFRHIEPHLDRLGALAGGHLDECARLADRHVPVLHQRDRFTDRACDQYPSACQRLNTTATRLCGAYPPPKLTLVSKAGSGRCPRHSAESASPSGRHQMTASTVFSSPLTKSLPST